MRRIELAFVQTLTLKGRHPLSRTGFARGGEARTSE
jgi:hypothetical protein